MNWKKDPNVTIGLCIALGVTTIIIVYLLMRDKHSSSSGDDGYVHPPQIPHEMLPPLRQPPQSAEQAQTPQALPTRPSRPSLVLFHAEWCGHCKHLQPTWQGVERALENSPIEALSFEFEQNKDIVSKQGIKGFPEIRLYPSGFPSADFKSYSGDRSFESIMNFAQSG